MLRDTQVDPDEAPEGYYAVLKADIVAGRITYPNLCHSCDWRPRCNEPETDLVAPVHRCMAVGVILLDGTVVRRNDGCSVVFKKKEKQ